MIVKNYQYFLKCMQPYFLATFTSRNCKNLDQPSANSLTSHHDINITTTVYLNPQPLQPPSSTNH